MSKMYRDTIFLYNVKPCHYLISESPGTKAGDPIVSSFMSNVSQSPFTMTHCLFSAFTCEARVSHPLHLALVLLNAKEAGEIVSSFSEKHNGRKVSELHPLTADCPLESGHFRAEVHSPKTSSHKFGFP